MSDVVTREANLVRALVNVGSEGWRLLRTFERFADNMDGDQKRRIAGRVAFFERKMREELESVGLRLVDFTGQLFGPELAASAVNAGDFGSHDELVVAQTLEPAIIGPDGVLKTGTVTLRRSV